MRAELERIKPRGREAEARQAEQLVRDARKALERDHLEATEWRGRSELNVHRDPDADARRAAFLAEEDD